jgi:pimeloyl-ACP methyl ester carboxylesterase
MELMTKPAPSPFENETGFLTHSLSFAKRISGTGYPFEEEQYKELILEEVKRAYDPGSVGRQIAAIAVSGDRRSRLTTLKVPALVIHGTDDPLFVPACGEDTASSIPDAKYMLIDGMGHDLPHQLYDIVIEAIIRTARKKW